jgi:hypothetical protein
VIGIGDERVDRNSAVDRFSQCALDLRVIESEDRDLDALLRAVDFFDERSYSGFRLNGEFNWPARSPLLDCATRCS